MQRFRPIPIIQPGGIQPYHQAGGQMPGPALTAMTNGTTLFGVNPADVTRQSQTMAKRRTLLDPVLASVIDGGGSASDSWDMRQDKGIYGQKQHPSKRHAVPLPQWQPRRKGIPT
jgi:hypothetical protein